MLMLMLMLMPVSAVTIEYKARGQSIGCGASQEMEATDSYSRKLVGAGFCSILVAVAAAAGSRALWRAKKGSIAAGNCDGQR
jgi:hypothetical protein